MSTRELRLQRFRGFSDAAIELKPLTVLLGPNSAGKSSFGQSLAALAHAHGLRRSGYFKTSLSPEDRPENWPVDLGGLSDLRTIGSTGPVRISVVTDSGRVTWGFGLEALGDDLILSHMEHPAEGAATTVEAPLFERLEPPTSQAGSTNATSAVGAVLRNRNRAPEMVLNLVARDRWVDGNGEPVTIEMEGLILRALSHTTGTLVPLSNPVDAEIRMLLENLTYLRAVRERPQRSYKQAAQQRQLVGYGGEGTAAALRESTAPVFEIYEPPPVPQNIEEADATIERSWQFRSGLSLSEAVSYWLRRMGLARALHGEAVPQRETESRIRTTIADSERDITEVGFGISQVVPVLTAGLSQRSGSLFVVELPEAQLHPRPQGELADFFCSLALNERWSLVETHSEMFFHRLRLRAEMNPKLRDLIAVYFVDEPAGGCCREPRRVGLTFDDELRWPEGFFQEVLDSEAAIAAVRGAKSRKGR